MIFQTSTQMNGPKCLEQAHTVPLTLVMLKNLNQPNLTPIKQELDDPMFDKHIEQDIALSNLLTQRHQRYSEMFKDKVPSNLIT